MDGRATDVQPWHPNAVVTGLNIVPLSDQPPANVVRFSFRTMVGIGTLLALIGLVYLFLRLLRRRASLPRLLLFCVVAAGPLSVVAALIAGWITTEVGRQPCRLMWLLVLLLLLQWRRGSVAYVSGTARGLGRAWGGGRTATVRVS